MKLNKNFSKLVLICLLITILTAGIVPLAAAGADTHKVSFLYVSGSAYLTQDVEQGAKLGVPLAPAIPAGKLSFIGWSTEKDTFNAYNFSKPVTSNLALYAHFSDKYMVSFKDADGDIYLFKLAEPGATVAQPQEAPQTTDESFFLYWTVDDGTGADHGSYEFTNPVNSNFVLRPIYGDSFYVYFHSMGGSPVDYQLIDKGDKAVRPEQNPARPGYNFSYWSLKEDAKPTAEDKAAYEYKFTENTVAESFTIYAVWDSSEMAYWPEVKVVIWQEIENSAINFDNSDTTDSEKDNYKNYVYYDSYIYNAEAGKEFNPSQSAVETYITPPDHSVFYKISPVVVEGDGSSAVNVYYISKVYTVYFDLAVAGAELKAGEETYTYDGDKYSVKAKYNMDLANLWPLNGNDQFEISHSTYLFQGWQPPNGLNSETNNVIWVSKRLSLTENMIPSPSYFSDSEYTVSATWLPSGYNVRLNYMFEALPIELNEDGEPVGTFGEDFVKYNGKYYTLDTRFTQNIISDGAAAMKLKEISGTRNVSEYVMNLSGTDLTNASLGEKNMFLLYNRNRYELSFDLMGGSFSGGGIASEIADVYWEQELSEVYPGDPAREGYVFKGWYEEREYLRPFDISENIMPFRNLELYARWEPAGLVASFYDQPEGTLLGEQNVEIGGLIKKPKEAIDDYFIKEGAPYEKLGVFRGWHHTMSNGLVVKYDFSNSIGKDTVLYGMYQTDNYAVNYESAGETEGTVPTDDDKYKLGVRAIVKGSESGLKAGSMVLAGWEETDNRGIIYYPGSTIEIFSDVWFEAVYANVDEMTTLTYNADYTADGEAFPEELSIPVILLKTYKLMDDQTFARNGYSLIGWAENSGSTEPDYEFDDLFEITAGDPVLYAVWAEIQYCTVTFAIHEDDVKKGEITSEFVFNVPKGSKSVEAIPVVSRPTVKLLPDDSGKVKYKFTGWEKLPEFITEDLIIYAAFEEIKDGGSSGTTTEPAKVTETPERTDNSKPMQGLESPVQGFENPLPGGNITIIWIIPIAIATFVFCMRRELDD
ncbi:hypothetical protein MmiAt1_03820 [Methanimicrococcus sp. At1]|uniref:Uncharacterized protein n=1 Tax=Methanimicrococcus hacksteinii TaxID=3028293 RepID=A0ABU3VN51_9EURY|nr:InlB B-repeat-containing protein [Methanimicrococcus sp. At1]MDV0444838.1 hypothetical protein [Methanimicrococcus sp. At1]